MKKKKLSPEKQRGGAIICPPDMLGRSKTARFFGIMCRAIVILFAVYGLALIFCDAVKLEVGGLYLFLVSSAAVTVFSLFFIPKVGIYIGTILSVGYVVLRYFLTSEYLRFLTASVLTVYNAFLQRLADRNFVRMVDFMVDVDNAGFGENELITYGVAVLVIFLAAVFVPCVLKKTRILLPTAVSALLFAVIFTYNLSNANWAFVLILASFSAIIVLKVYDNIYMKGLRKNRPPENVGVFVDKKRPEMPTEAVLEQARREDERARRQAERDEKAETRKRHREQGFTIDEEISNYFDTPSRKPKKEKAPKAQKGKRDKDAKKHENEVKAQIRQVHKYDRGTRTTRSAMGGFAAIGTFVLIFLVLALPALFTDKSFADIPAISEPMNFYREYLTAFLRGDEVILDDLNYADNYANFAPRPTDATPREYDGTQFFYIESANTQDIYLTGWIATDYRDGAWYTASYRSEQNIAFRSLYASTYDRQSTPYESVYFNFMQTYYPYDMREVEFSEGRQTISSAHGYVAQQINIKRLATIGTASYFPSRFNADYKLRSYGSSSKSGLGYVNFFDGIYTGNGFNELLAEYAVVSYLQDQSNASWYKSISNSIAQFNEGYNIARDQVLEPRKDKIEIYREREQTIAKIVEVIYKDVYRSNESDVITVTIPSSYIGAGRYVITTEHDEEAGKVYIITCEERQVKYTLYDTGEVTKVGLNGNRSLPDLPFAVRYAGLMDYPEKTQVASMYYDYYIYRNFVYGTYNQKPDSEVISAYYENLINSLTEEEYNELFTDKNGFEYRGARTDSTSNVTYENRHELVMKIISTLSAKDSGYTYTLTPTAAADPELDGVENFLTVTKEGYCVQFASAVALLLREAGIPARYVEGYVASEFTRNYDRNSNFDWISIVKDENAHAWVEVWYDGIGWVQYEATPNFYNDAYGIVDETDPDQPGDDTDDTTVSDTDVSSDIDTGDTSDTDTEDTTTVPGVIIPGTPGGIDPETLKAIITVAVIALAIAAAVAVIVILIKKREDKHHQEIKELLDAAEEKRVPEAERRDTARRLIDMTMRLFEIYGTPRGKSEFRDAYAERMQEEYLEIFGKDARNPEYINDPTAPEFIKVSDTDFKAIFADMAAEEFGVDGMSDEALSRLAVFYKRLYTALPAKLSAIDRFVWVYIKLI